jgi:hypothetical protein
MGPSGRFEVRSPKCFVRRPPQDSRDTVLTSLLLIRIRHTIREIKKRAALETRRDEARAGRVAKASTHSRIAFMNASDKSE